MVDCGRPISGAIAGIVAGRHWHRDTGRWRPSWRSFAPRRSKTPSAPVKTRPGASQTRIATSHAVDEVIAEMVECDSQRIDVARPHAGAPSRATQTIPPAIRRYVLRRDRNRCIVPGCQNHTFLDAHHLDPRSEGGGHDPERLGTVCGAHHRSVHDGHLCIGGTASAGFTFHHADGSPYGAQLRPVAIDAAAHVCGALQNLGFRQARARELVDAVLRDGAPDDPAAFLQAALRAS